MIIQVILGSTGETGTLGTKQCSSLTCRLFSYKDSPLSWCPTVFTNSFFVAVETKDISKMYRKDSSEIKDKLAAT